jgi:hypothetical protein
MSGIIDLHADIIDRTVELMQSRLETIGDIAFHTGLDANWLTIFSTRAADRCRVWDVSSVYLLHDWLIVLELACPIQRYGCNDAMRIIGEASCYAVRSRLLNAISGLAPLAECWPVLRRAEARVDGLRDTNEWKTLQGDDEAEEALQSYLGRGADKYAGLNGVRRAQTLS